MDKIYYIPTNKNILHLTFDDGTNNPTTSIILDILKFYNIKATFFVLMENVLKNTNILKRIINEEHTVGLHGYGHKSFSKHPKLAIYRHIKKSIDILHDSFGVDVEYFRPPYGTLTKDTETVIKEFNLIPVGWSIFEKDYQAGRVDKKSDSIMRKCSPGQIIVMHDGYRQLKHQGTTIENLKQILPKLINQGYSFVSIPELVSSKLTIQHKSFNNIPLLGHRIVNFINQNILFLYWDVNYIKSNGNTFEIKIMNDNMSVKFPSPNAMEEWPQKIILPLEYNDSEIFIKNNGIFFKI
jgi:peptidoglycan/xylan/chitin deacetylase (PgdA/CDA1 family)